MALKCRVLASALGIRSEQASGPCFQGAWVGPRFLLWNKQKQVFLVLSNLTFSEKKKSFYKGIPPALARFETISSIFLIFYVVNLFPLYRCSGFYLDMFIPSLHFFLFLSKFLPSALRELGLAPFLTLELEII